MAFYYPEGYFGPICDALVSDQDITDRSRRAINIDEIGDPTVPVLSGGDDWHDEPYKIFPTPPTFWLGMDCKEGTLPDGTKYYYDCVHRFTDPPPNPGDPWNMKDIGLTETFFQPTVTPDSCSPFDSDINIRPIIFYDANGNQVTKNKRALSLPVTYDVTSETNEIEESSGTLTADFASDGNSLTVGGTGVGNILFKFDWNDNPNTAGVAVDKIVINGKGFTQGNNTWWTNPAGVAWRVFSNTGNNTVATSLQCTAAGNSGQSGTSNWVRTGPHDHPQSAWDTFMDTYCIYTYKPDNDVVDQYIGTAQTATTQITIAQATDCSIELRSDNTSSITWTDPNGTVLVNKDVQYNTGNTIPGMGQEIINLGTLAVGVHNISFSITNDFRRDQTGEHFDGFEVVPGSYGITYTNLNSANSPISVVDSNQRLCLKDGHGGDCNANFRIHNLASQTTVNNEGYWSEEANTYGVWVNPMICTLPQEEQTVTYLIPIPADDTYGFTFGCDDNAQIFLNDSTTPLLTAVGGMFASGANSTPSTTTTSLTAGTLKLVVNCTNSDAGFQDSNGKPTGLAFSWQRNPGGWYIKICRGGVCNSAASSQWVRSGPHPDWSTFMNDYAVYPSNTDVLSGTTHTNNWTVPILSAGNYNLEVQADNYGSFEWDGTSLGTIGQNVSPFNGAFTSSTNYTITNASVGNHVLAVGVFNGTGNPDWATNPGGVAFQLTSSVAATFAANGDLVTTGSGSCTMVLNFVWSDNPNTYSQALGTYAISELGVSFTQTSGVQSGSESKTVTVEGGKTYTCTITNNSGGFERQNTNTKMCFKDLDGNDCNAALTFTLDNVIISSTDLSETANYNLIWHTRMATGYEYYTP